MCAIRRWPRPMRCSVAMRAPRSSSLATTSTPGQLGLPGARDHGGNCPAAVRSASAAGRVPTAIRPSTRRSTKVRVRSSPRRRLSGRRRAACEARVVQPGVQTVQQLHEPGVAHVVEEHPDRTGAPLAEAARRGVGPVAELLDGGQHGLPLLVTDLVGAAQHEGDQRLRHSGPLGDVANRRCSHGLRGSIPGPIPYGGRACQRAGHALQRAPSV